MTKEVLPGIYQIEVPLPGNPLKATNSYVIKGKKRDLVIDTGMNREECSRALWDAFENLDINPHHTDYFITHIHADHIGLVSVLAEKSSHIFFNAPDAAVFGDQGLWEKALHFVSQNGFPKEELQRALSRHPGYRFSPKNKVEFTILKEGDTLEYGRYRLHCIETPGHTRGSMCLFEPEEKILFSGDHVLVDITPNISAFSGERLNPLKEYLGSLEKVRDLDVQLVLPGHRSLFKDLRGRVDELLKHHTDRENEVLSILEKGPQSAYQVASQMSWDMDYSSWNEFPMMQRWFATGEALAHLEYLRDKEAVEREMKDSVFVYEKTNLR